MKKKFQFFSQKSDRFSIFRPLCNGENKRKRLDKLDDALALDDDNGVHDNY